MHIPDRRSLVPIRGLLSSPVAQPEPPRLRRTRTRLARMLAALGAYRRDRRAAAELEALDDRLLADIGLNRWDLPFARETPWPAGPWWCTADRGFR